MTSQKTRIRSLSRRERIAWLRLARSERVGPITFFHLLSRYGSAEEGLNHLPGHARNAGRKQLRLCTKAAAERELEAVERMGGKIVAMPEPDFPPRLREVANAPPLLTVLGNTHLLQRPTVGIVGARNASVNGRRLAERLAADLAAEGYLVVSGLARGIDTAAHRGALGGATAAVVAGGADVIYPPENEDLYHRIVDTGAVIAEMPVGFSPGGRHFPRRNRIIAGMASGIVVVEAAMRSGSLITASMAGDVGREVFAVPGSPLDPRCEGTNILIRQGAQLVRNSSDILEALATMADHEISEPASTLFTAPDHDQTSQESDAASLNRLREILASMLSPTPTPVDELIRHCQFSPAEVRGVLSEMEIAGRIEVQAGGRVALVMDPKST